MISILGLNYKIIYPSTKLISLQRKQLIQNKFKNIKTFFSTTTLIKSSGAPLKVIDAPFQAIILFI